MSVNRKLRQRSKRDARRTINDQLSDVEEDAREYIESLPSETELQELEYKAELRRDIINGRDPETDLFFETVIAYDALLEDLVPCPSTEEEGLIREVRQRIRYEQQWNAIFVADYYADLDKEWRESVASI